MKFLKPIRENRGQEELISRKIKQFFDDLLFDFMEAVLKNNRLENALGLRELIRRGDVVFESGVFRFEHRISNNVAKEIEALGGKFSRALKGYKIDIKKIPPVLQQAIAEVKINNADKVKKIQAYLDNLQDTKQFALDRLKFDDEVIKIGADLDRQFKEVTKPVLEIAPKMTEFQKSEIAKNYTNNLEYYIRKWTDQEIVKLREDIQPLVMAGYRTDSLEKIISRHKGVSERKAKFLARQETRLLVAEYTKNRMKQAGISRFRWRTVLDGRERPEHKALNGQIFAFDELPIIDARTGEKGMPGQAFNCRCWAEAVIDWTLLNNDKTDVNGCLHGDDGKFKSKTAHKSVVNLSKEEYNHVVHELNNNLTKKEFKWKRTTRYIGNYGYDVIINDFNDYKIVDKWSIENADN
ncbi:MAG: minor capsid protein [Alphaproteobacteria bacterium]|nr:minor capsid protein [Alphaproteobacteria bacterium]MBR1648496.1 minor capsid protein [Alphaproteobacteria bacterium]